MDTKSLCQYIIDLGIPIAVIASRAHRDPSTIGHWLKGRTNISERTEQAIYDALKQIRQDFIDIKILE